MPWTQILETARAENADAIGLSGLITPSLEEMRTVADGDGARGHDAAAADRRRDDVARPHRGPASSPRTAARSSTCRMRRARWASCARCSTKTRATSSCQQTRASYARAAPPVRGSRRPNEARLTIARGARPTGSRIDWRRATPPRANLPGRARLRDMPLEELVELHRLDAVLHDLGAARPLPGDPRPTRGGRGGARRCSTTPRSCCERVVDERLLQANAAVGFWPATSTADDDIVLYTDEQRTTELDRLHTLRQQMAKTGGRPDVALVGLHRAGRIGRRATTSAPSR